MLFNKFIAEFSGEVGQSWFDFFTIGHLCMGIGIFLLFSLFYTIPMGKDKGVSRIILPLWVVWIITVLMGILWEIVENTIFYHIGIKFETRLDSFQNIFTDILFVGLGGLITWILAHFIFKAQKRAWVYYVFGITGLSLWIGLFIVLRYLTLSHPLSIS